MRERNRPWKKEKFAFPDPVSVHNEAMRGLRTMDTMAHRESMGKYRMLLCDTVSVCMQLQLSGLCLLQALVRFTVSMF